MAVKQTAGRTQLGEFAPKFAELNDDVLFGEVWSREEQLSLRDRSLVTVVALMAQGLTDESFKYHLQSAKICLIQKLWDVWYWNQAVSARRSVICMSIPHRLPQRIIFTN